MTLSRRRLLRGLASVAALGPLALRRSLRVEQEPFSFRKALVSLGFEEHTCRYDEALGQPGGFTVPPEVVRQIAESEGAL